MQIEECQGNYEDCRNAKLIADLQSKLQAASKLLDDWAEAERQGLGVPILAGIGQLREALK